MPNGELRTGRSQSAFPKFLVGQDSHGHWVVRDQAGLQGGLFLNRAEALHFALFESEHHPQAVIMVPGVLELDMAPGGSPPVTHRVM